MTIQNLTSQFGLSQIINEATHILEAFSLCIDLIFTTQPKLVVESGVHPSLHENCHHQLVFAKFKLQIYYPPPYLREIWHYKQGNSELIRRAISNFNWDRAFLEYCSFAGEQSIESGSFPSEWKKGNVVPIHKKDDKQYLSNYRPVSLLPICGKIFERLIFNEMFKFFSENELI